MQNIELRRNMKFLPVLVGVPLRLTAARGPTAFAF